MKYYTLRCAHWIGTREDPIEIILDLFEPTHMITMELRRPCRDLTQEEAQSLLYKMQKLTLNEHEVGYWAHLLEG